MCVPRMGPCIFSHVPGCMTCVSCVCLSVGQNNFCVCRLCYVCVSEHTHLRGCDSVSLGLMRCWRVGGLLDTAESAQTEHSSEPLKVPLLSALHVCAVLACVFRVLTQRSLVPALSRVLGCRMLIFPSAFALRLCLPLPPGSLSPHDDPRLPRQKPALRPVTEQTHRCSERRYNFRQKV